MLKPVHKQMLKIYSPRNFQYSGCFNFDSCLKFVQPGEAFTQAGS